MRAISILSLEVGTSTRWCLAAAALRRRVRKSAMGSVCISFLPARFRYAGNFAFEGHPAETDSAHLKLANVGARAAAHAATVTHAHFKFWFFQRLSNFCGTSHVIELPLFREAGNRDS